MPRCRRCLAWLSCCALVFGRTAIADESADLLRTFRSQYRSASLALEQAYRQVRIFGTVTRYDGKGDFFYKGNFEIFRSGESGRSILTVSGSGKPNLLVGTITGTGGNREKKFEVEKKPTDKDYVISWFGPDRQFDLWVHAACFPATAPFAFNFKVELARDYILESKDLRLVSAKRIRRDDVDLVELVAEKTNPDQKIVEDRFYFRPSSWALVGWRFDFSQQSSPINSWHGIITYSEDGSPPKLKSVETWHEEAKAGVKKGRFVYDIEGTEFGDIPARQFTLASLGIEEPALLSAGTNRFWLISVNALVVFLLGLLIFIRAYRRRETLA